MKTTKYQYLWNKMRELLEFSTQDLWPNDPKNNTVRYYVGALVRSGHLEIIGHAVKTEERRYALALNTGPLSPIYISKKSEGGPIVKDRNIGRDFEVAGKRTTAQSKEREAMLKLFEEKERVSYEELLQIFINPKKKEGYNYTSLCHYLKWLQKQELIIELKHHVYVKNF